MVTRSGPPAPEASASGGWDLRPAPPEPIPPEVLDLFAAGSFTLIEEYTLAAPAGGGPGGITMTMQEPGTSRRAVLVVLRDAQRPDVAFGTASRGQLTFHFEAGAHDDGARLLLLAVRADTAGPEPAPAPAAARDLPRTPHRP